VNRVRAWWAGAVALVLAVAVIPFAVDMGPSWGSYSDYLGAVTGGLALMAAIALLGLELRERGQLEADRRRADAQLVASWAVPKYELREDHYEHIDPEEFESRSEYEDYVAEFATLDRVLITIRNGGQLPVYRVTICVAYRADDQLAPPCTVFVRAAVDLIAPLSVEEIERDIYQFASKAGVEDSEWWGRTGRWATAMDFSDASSRRWRRRRLADGRLLELADEHGPSLLIDEICRHWENEVGPRA